MKHSSGKRQLFFGKLNELWNAKAFCDVQFDTTDGLVAAHSVVLAASSPVLCARLQVVQGHSPFQYNLKHFTSDACTSVLDYIYRGELPKEQSKLRNFLLLVHEWEIKIPIPESLAEDVRINLCYMEIDRQLIESEFDDTQEDRVRKVCFANTRIKKGAKNFRSPTQHKSRGTQTETTYDSLLPAAAAEVTIEETAPDPFQQIHACDEPDRAANPISLKRKRTVTIFKEPPSQDEAFEQPQEEDLITIFPFAKEYDTNLLELINQRFQRESSSSIQRNYGGKDLMKAQFLSSEVVTGNETSGENSDIVTSTENAEISLYEAPIEDIHPEPEHPDDAEDDHDDLGDDLNRDITPFDKEDTSNSFPYLGAIFDDHCYVAKSTDISERTDNLEHTDNCKLDAIQPDNVVHVRKKRKIDPTPSLHPEMENTETAGPANVICPICGKRFSTQDKLTKHRNHLVDTKERAHMAQEKLTCDICDMKFIKRNLYLAHMVENHYQFGMEEPIIYRCKHDAACTFTTYRQKMIYYHHRFHHKIPEEKPERKMCKLCGKTFKHDKSLGGHMRLQHNNNEQHTCESCGKTFRIRYLYLLHREYCSVVGKEMTSCNFCNYFTLTKETIYHHLSRSHNVRGEGGFTTKIVESEKDIMSMCETCGNYFTYRQMYAHRFTGCKGPNSKRNKRGHLPPEKWTHCKWCTLKFASVPGFYMHVKKYHTDKLISCDLCDHKSVSERGMKSHKEKKHSTLGPDGARPKRNYKPRGVREQLPNGPIMCHICGKVKTRGRNFYAHMRTHRLAAEKKESCSICGREVIHLKAHMRVHTRKQCKICKIEVSDLYLHMKEKHNYSYAKHRKAQYVRQKRLQCEVCGKVVLEQNLEMHKESHSPEGFVECNLCGRTLCGPISLARHMKRHEEDPLFCAKDLVCHICDYKLQTRAALRIHMTTYHKTEPDKCDYCPFKTLRTGALKQHLRKFHSEHLEIKYRCTLCPSEFYFKTDYYCHRRNVHPPGGVKVKRKNLRIYRWADCKFCGKSFKQGSLLQHLGLCKFNPNPKVHICNICGFKSNRRNGIMTHMYSHRPKPDKCPHCDYTSFEYRAVTKHIKRAHPNISPHFQIYKCSQCSFVCRKLVELYTHEKETRHNMTLPKPGATQHGSARSLPFSPTPTSSRSLLRTNSNSLLRTASPAKQNMSTVSTTVAGAGSSWQSENASMVQTHVVNQPQETYILRDFMTEGLSVMEADLETQEAINQILYETTELGADQTEQQAVVHHTIDWDTLTVVTQSGMS